MTLNYTLLYIKSNFEVVVNVKRLEYMYSIVKQKDTILH